MFRFIILIFLPIYSVAHDYHVTHTTLYLNKETNSLEITVKVAIEDLERALNTKNNKFNIGTQNELETVNNMISNYVSNILKIDFNNQDIKYKFIGKEVHNNLHDIYLYFEGFVYEKVNNFTIYLENKLFIENEPNQINIVLFEIFDKSYNRTFTKDNTIQKVVINKL